MLKFCSQFLIDLFKVQSQAEQQIINEKVKVEQIPRQIIIAQDAHPLLPTECCWATVNSYSKSTLSKEALRQLNKYKFIETCISCLDNQEFSYLNSLFQNYYSINLSSGKKPLINYPSFLQELFYDDFESTIHSYLMNKFGVKYKEQQVLVIATYLMKLFLSESTNLRIINFNRHQNFHKLDMPNLLLGKKSTKNSFLTLDSCKNIHYLDFKFKHHEYNDIILLLIIEIIKSQKHISEFNISNLKNNFEIILSNLLLLHKNTLVSMRLEGVYISENSVDMLKQFGNIRKIKLLHCNKLTSEVLPDYSEYIAKLKYLYYYNKK